MQPDITALRDKFITMQPDELVLSNNIKATQQQLTAIDNLPENTPAEKLRKAAFQKIIRPHWEQLTTPKKNAAAPLVLHKPITAEDIASRRAALVSKPKK